ncbi:MAG: hypothetical protein N0E48_08560 [Candidatus Thiodiazotropha endolucinida]|nr:hypothetical protein [Candidatus Thiodiazotropha taylori]MCW4343398.1 hypothetical protein [Candidatus Thiodiazotropha endolucinida]
MSAWRDALDKGWQRVVSLVIRAHQVETWCSIMIAMPSSVLTRHLRADEWVRVVCQGNELSWQAFFSSCNFTRDARHEHFSNRGCPISLQAL